MKKKILCKILILTMFIIGINVTISKAAISATSKTVNSGENFSVSISSNVSVGSYKVTMTNSGGVKFVTSSGGDGAGTNSITRATANEGMTSLATYTFKAPEVSNDTTYNISFLATAMEDMNLNPISNDSATATITVKAASSGNTGTSTSGGNTSNTASNNAKLANLGITPNDFSGFKSGTTTYNATVPNNVTSVQVYAKVQAPGAKYSVSGPYKNLQVGTNKIAVTVTAPDGKTTNTYTIYVARQASKDEEVTPNVIDENSENNEQPGTEEPEENQEAEALGLLTISIDEGHEIYLEPEFKTDIYEYTINLKEDLSEIPLTAIANRENAIIEITGNEDLQEGENIITITVTDEEKGEKAEYKITVKKAIVAQEEAEPEEDKNLKEREWLIIAIATGAVAVVIIIIVSCVIIKRRKKFESEFDVDYDEEDYNENYAQYYNQVNSKQNTHKTDSVEEKDLENKDENKNENRDENRDENKDENPVDEKPKLDDVFGKSYVEEYEEEKPKMKRRGKGKHF